MFSVYKHNNTILGKQESGFTRISHHPTLLKESPKFRDEEEGKSGREEETETFSEARRHGAIGLFLRISLFFEGCMPVETTQ